MEISNQSEFINCRRRRHHHNCINYSLNRAKKSVAVSHRGIYGISIVEGPPRYTGIRVSPVDNYITNTIVSKMDGYRINP